MSAETQNSMQDIERENRRLKDENQVLKNKLDNKCGPMMNDTVDGIVITLIIFVIVTAVVIWLNHMPG